MNDFDTRLGDALRDRVRGEQPDLRQLTEGSVRAGTRIKHRRTAGIAAGVLAGLAAAAVVAIGLPGGGTADPGPEVGPAAGSSGSSAPTLDEECLERLDDFRVSHGKMPTDDSALDDYVNGLGEQEGNPPSTREDQLKAMSPRLCEEPPVEEDSSASVGKQDLPITFALEGWNCDFPADDKFPCSGPNDAWLSFVVRDAADHDYWADDADKGGDPNTVWVSEVHDNYFVSVQGKLRGTPLDDVIGGLTLAPTWER